MDVPLGQVLLDRLLIGVAGASLPLALPIAFGVGCVSGISAGALSEFTVDSLHDKVRNIGKREEEFMKEESQKECIKSTVETMNSSSDSAIEKRIWTAEEADLIARLVCKFL